MYISENQCLIRKIITFVIFLFSLHSLTYAASTWLPFKQEVTLPAKPEFKILKEDTTGIVLETTISGMNVEEKTDDRREDEETRVFHLASIPGYEYSFTQEVGKPKLPVISVQLAIPDGVEIKVSYDGSKDPHYIPTKSEIRNPKSKIKNYLIYPVPRQDKDYP
ncbi:MAG: hypothetical protein AB1422_05480 [bacterium]